MYYNTRKKIRVALSFLWFIIPMVVLAHSTSQSSTVLVKSKSGQWTLQVRSALSAFESVVNNKYTVKGYNTPKEFEELVFTLMSKNLSLKINGQEVKLSDPKIKLGHETLVVYLIDVPETFKTVSLNNTMFQDIFKSKNTFMILKNGVNRNIFALEKNNNFEAKVKLVDNKFILVSNTNSLAGNALSWYVVPFLATLSVFGFIFKFKKRKKLIPDFNSKLIEEMD
ncbi:DUF6702 family protein [uncultured Formosa sp.]|uniref:DUF6702 family protein n=1 Tax=uncultured Formosa sp. TaxID=255435 RepID=UPI002609F5B4|nr:DUF6702 family protein [uncultured Formosa sp.]